MNYLRALSPTHSRTDAITPSQSSTDGDWCSRVESTLQAQASASIAALTATVNGLLATVSSQASTITSLDQVGCFLYPSIKLMSMLTLLWGFVVAYPLSL